MRIDLHMHSAASDGELSPTSLVHAARAGGLDVIALTDHDTVSGVPEAIAAAGDRPVVVPGIEISCTHAGRDLHLLGYQIDPEHPALSDYGHLAVEGRARRMRAMVERLNDLGIAVDYEDVLAAAGPDTTTLGRPHLANALLERGHVRTFGEAFDRFIGDDGPAFVPTELVTPARAIELIHSAGGVSVWAHPRLDVFEVELPRLAGWGIDGVECIRPQHSPDTVRRLVDAAAELDLLVTGGSDWHGEWHGPLGRFAVDPGEISAFLERTGL